MKKQLLALAAVAMLVSSGMTLAADPTWGQRFKKTIGGTIGGITDAEEQDKAGLSERVGGRIIGSAAAGAVATATVVTLVDVAALVGAGIYAYNRARQDAGEQCVTPQQAEQQIEQAVQAAELLEQLSASCPAPQ